MKLIYRRARARASLDAPPHRPIVSRLAARAAN
jgi:hypothetical protein